MLGVLGRFADRMVRPFGYRMLPTWRLAHLEEASHVRALLDLYRVDLVVDVGANRGQYRDFLRQHVGYAGAIASFEPIAENVRVLRERAATDPDWRVFDYALGAESCTRTFNVMSRDTFSSFLPPDHSADSREVHESNTVVRKEDVRVRTLDEMWPELVEGRTGARVYLKMDTQGFDAEVLKGAQRCLPDVVAGQTELLFQPMYGGAPTPLEALRGLDAVGLDVAGLFPDTRDFALRVRACDCTFVNRSQARAIRAQRLPTG